jgi:hypothetical protein
MRESLGIRLGLLLPWLVLLCGSRCISRGDGRLFLLDARDGLVGLASLLRAAALALLVLLRSCSRHWLGRWDRGDDGATGAGRGNDGLGDGRWLTALLAARFGCRLGSWHWLGGSVILVIIVRDGGHRHIDQGFRSELAIGRRFDDTDADIVHFCVSSGFLVRHVFGVRVTVLIGVHARVVELEVISVCLSPELLRVSHGPKTKSGLIPCLLIGTRHVIPSADTLGADSPLGYIWAQVLGDDGTGRLHVEEVRGERSLWRVRIMDSLLLLFLGFGGH